MNAVERATYEPWRDARPPFRDGSSIMNSFLAGFRLGVAYGELTKTEVECDGCGNRVDVPTVGDSTYPRGVCPTCGGMCLPAEQTEPMEDPKWAMEAWS